MDSKLVAIVGSADTSRTDYDPPLVNPAVAKQAARELGAALAEEGHSLLVYTSDERFIERDFVSGYFASGKAKKHSIIIVQPAGGGSKFAEQDNDPDQVFLVDRYTEEHWDVTFERSLERAGAVILIGGARSGLLTGIMAGTHGIPLVPVAAFGGSARTLWRLTGGVLEDADRNLLGDDVWRSDSAKRVVASLQRERKRPRDEVDRQPLYALIFFALALGSTAVAAAWSRAPHWLFLLLLFATPLLAGCAGGKTREITDPQRADRPGRRFAFVLGGIAGAISGLLFVLPNIISVLSVDQKLPDASPQAQMATAMASAVTTTLAARALVLIACIVGFIAGFTTESVFAKLRSQEVLTTASLKPPGSA